MEPLALLLALAMGLGAKALGLPPLVGFLVAGFLLHPLGIGSGPLIDDLADAGVTLLMFTIGLKLKLGTLAKPEVWAGATVHMAIIIALFGVLGLGFAALAVPLFDGLDLAGAALVGFSLSFSSTVFAFKVLEEKGELNSLHARIAVGILIMQDVIAVVFLAFSAGKIPSIWALGLFLLIPLRPLLGRLLERAGHGELLLLAGLSLAFGVGYAGFELVGMKGDLGALVVGVLVGSHPKGNELSKSLLSVKDMLLVGFFLEIGLSKTPSIEFFAVGLLLLVLVPIKSALFFALLTRFKLRARTGLLASLSLSNYSEFGLIVASVAVANGWLSGDWLIEIAVVLSMSFVLASPLNARAHNIYQRLTDRLMPFERDVLHDEERPIETGDASVLVFGMGRVGTAAYDAIAESIGERVLGLDANPEVVAQHRVDGRNVASGDATDTDFWRRLRPGALDFVVLAMNEQRPRLDALEQLAAGGYRGTVAAIARFADEQRELEAAGATAVYNFYDEAGAGLGAHIREQMADFEPSLFDRRAPE